MTPLSPTAEFETRYCQGKKVTLYNKAKLEKWAPYLNGDGLVQRLTIYAGPDCKRNGSTTEQTQPGSVGGKE